jgi:hypothetical protein
MEAYTQQNVFLKRFPSRGAAGPPMQFFLASSDSKKVRYRFAARISKARSAAMLKRTVFPMAYPAPMSLGE